MTLSQSQLSMVERARSVGGGGQGVALSNDVCSFLVATLARDLEIPPDVVPVPSGLPDFFARVQLETLTISGRDFLADLASVLTLEPDADSYFACLAKLHKTRLKYQRILETQPIPTLDQVGPRALLQYGQLSPSALAGLLFWRKWFFDIDNRAGQETGYLFEPIIALSIGGVPASAGKSPVKRHGNKSKGRQVDCIKGDRAYEFKLRVTIAASGQGRWGEEIDFPTDCARSGYKPVLVVFDPTPNPKLDELVKVFIDEGGDAFVGDGAWKHLETQAGATMARFLEAYVRRPLADLMASATSSLPELRASLEGSEMLISVESDFLRIKRHPQTTAADDVPFPDDVDDEAGGV